MENIKVQSVVAAVILSVIGVFGLMPQPLIVGALQDHLGFTSQQASLITAAEVFGGALASILAVFWIRRINWRTATFFAIVVVVIGNFVSSYLTGFGSLITVRFIVGILGQGTAFVVAISIISNTTNPDRNFAFSIASQVAFAIIGFAVLPYAIAQWQLGGILLPLGALALLALVFIAWVPTGSGEHAGDDEQATDVRIGLPLVALGALMIWCLGLGGIYAFEERIGVAAGLEKTAVGSALAAAVAVGFLGAIAASWVADRWGRILPVTIALLMQIVAVLLLQGEMTWILFTLIASVFHFFWNFTGPYLMGTVASADQTGRISVLIPAAQTGGFAIGAAIAGNLMTSGTLTPANYVASAGCLVALLFFIPTASRIKQSASA